jgi:hypothetical protein
MFLTNIPKDSIKYTNMGFVRNFKGNIVEINPDNFLNDWEFYEHLWKIKYDITLDKLGGSFNAKLIHYIKGDNFFI